MWMNVLEGGLYVHYYIGKNSQSIFWTHRFKVVSAAFKKSHLTGMELERIDEQTN